MYTRTEIIIIIIILAELYRKIIPFNRLAVVDSNRLEEGTKQNKRTTMLEISNP